jgi:Urea transporter
MGVKQENIILETIKALLHGVSQVLLIENAISGLIILIACYVAALEVGIAATIAVIVGTATARGLGMTSDKIKAGLFGFSPVLVGIATVTFIQGINKWIIVVIGSIIVTFITIFVNNLLAVWEMPSLTLPFIIVTWLVLLASYQMTTIQTDLVGVLPQMIEETGVISNWLDALTKGIGEVFILDNVVASLLILVAIFVAGIKEVIRVILAIAFSWGFVLISGMSKDTFSMGLYTYNIILTFLAAGTFLKLTSRNVGITICGGILTMLLDIVLNVLAAPYGIPILTMPFVLATFVMLMVAKAGDNAAKCD